MASKEFLEERKRIILEQLTEYDRNPAKFIADWTVDHHFCPDIKERLSQELSSIEAELFNG